MKTLKYLVVFLICYLVKIVILKENENSKQTSQIPKHFSRLGRGTTFVEIDPDLKPIPDHIEDEIAQLQMTGQPVVITTNGDEYNEGKAKKISQLKHSPSASALLFPDTSKRPEEMSKSIKNLMERTIEPTKTVINLNKMSNILENLHKLKLEELPTLSKIIVVHDGNAYIPCLACAHEDKERALVLIPEGLSEKELEKLWLDTNKDFMQMRVVLDKSLTNADPKILTEYAKNCGNVKGLWLKNNELGEESINPYLLCLRLYLLSQHNVAFHKHAKKSIIGRFGTREVFPDELLEEYEKSKMSMIIHGFSTSSYTFGIIMEKTDFRVDPFALLQPFGILIWMLLLLSLFLSTIVMYALAYSKSHDVPFWETFFFNVCLLLDQADNDFIRRTFRKGFWKATPYLAAWMFCSFVLKTLYQGALYSNLSVSTMPPYPKNIDELMKWDPPINVVFCHDDVQPIKDHFERLREHGVAIEEMSEERQKFLFWVYWQIIPYNNHGNDAKWILDSALNSSPDPLPKEFAVIGSQSNVEMFTTLTKLFYKNKVEMKVEGEMPLVREKFVISSKNVLNSHLSKTYSRLHESGILGFLQKWSDKVEPKIRVANWIKKESEKGHMPEHLKQHSYSMLMAPNKASQKGDAELFPEQKNVSFESVKFPLIIFGLMLALAFVVFITEIVIFSVTKKLEERNKEGKKKEEIPSETLS